MPTALDAPPDALDPQETHLVSNIREHSWFRTNVLADDDGPGFSYTTGFWLSVGAPEVIVFSLPSRVAHDVLWDVYRLLHEGASLLVGRRLSNDFGKAEAVFLPVSKEFYPEYLGWGRWFYGGDDWPCLQLIWPNPDGAFPWEVEHGRSPTHAHPNLSGGPWPSI